MTEPKTSMLIALDYDDTFTRDPHLWAAFIGLARSNGHEVHIVTNREPTQLADVVIPPGLDYPVRIISCGSSLKRSTCARAKVFPHVWIDDCPEMIGEVELLAPPVAPRPCITVSIQEERDDKGGVEREVVVHLVDTWSDEDEVTGARIWAKWLNSNEISEDVIAGVSRQFERRGFQVIELEEDEG